LRSKCVAPGAAPAARPAGWEETLTPEGDRVLIRDRKTRKKQVVVLGVIAAFAWTLALALAWAAATGPAIALTLIAALFACGAYWLDVGRQEFRLGGERVVVLRPWRGKLQEMVVVSAAH